MPLKTVKFRESVENIEKFSKLEESEELVPVKPIGSPEVKKTVPGS